MREALFSTKITPYWCINVVFGTFVSSVRDQDKIRFDFKLADLRKIMLQAAAYSKARKKS